MPSARLPELGPALPRSGGPVLRALGHFVLRLMEWRVTGELPNTPKLVVIVAPHTSNWDFVVGIAAKLALGLDVQWLGKNTLFRFPFGAAMRALGGIPVDRSAAHDVVGGIVAEFGRRDQLVLGLAPEGTRKRVERWRTGFYHIAHGARAPIVPVALNYGERAVQIGAPFAPTGDIERDVADLQHGFIGVKGRNVR